MITGEYWAYKSPSFYEFRHFRFVPAIGGLGPEYASFGCSFSIENYEGLVQDIEKIHEDYPHSFIAFRKGRYEDIRISVSPILEISIVGPHGMLFDYEMNLAKDIESHLSILEKENYLGPPISDVKWEPWIRLQPLVESEYVKFDEKGINWVHSSPNAVSGLEMQRLRIDMHSPDGLNDQIFFNELRQLLDQCNIEYLDYQELSNNYMIFLGNGRQGIGGIPYTFSDREYFKQKFLILIEKYGFILDHDKKFVSYEVALSNYFALVDSTVNIIKDERKQMSPLSNDL